ncbi:MAG: tetratricopeptide repeat protein [Bacteroidales bacterium]|nr:tetratricopeptide repeat protein [Bacteroidales bacterium]
MSSPKKPGRTSESSRSGRWIYNIILILFPILFFIIIELLLRLFHYGDSYKLFIDHPEKEYKSYYIINPEIGKKHFRKFEHGFPPNDIFLKEKPDDCFRIFVMGSSTVMGFPYDKNLMFSRILHKRLEEAYPAKKIEIINTAITAQNSFSLLDYMPEILRQEPDAILIYAGHNEFYGAFGAGSNEAMSKNNKFTSLHLRLMKLRIYQLIQNSITGIAGVFGDTDTSADKRGTLMKRIVNKSNIIYKGELYNKGMEQYESNMRTMLTMASKKKVPVFISNLVCNVRDLPPFYSIDTLDLPAAIRVYNEAKNAENNGEYNKAKQLYYKAKDLDCVRFRASSEVNEIIEKLAEEYRLYFVPTLSYFEKASEHGLVGNNLLTEHVHPNISGYFLMAEAFYNEITKSKLIADNTNRFEVKSLPYFKSNYGYTLLDSLIGYHRIANLKHYWPFRDERDGIIDYRLIYRPVSVIDSLAFEVMRNPELIPADAHLTLAEAYTQRGNHLKAFKEFDAMVRINPYWADYYRGAALGAIQIQDLSLALEYFNKSLQYTENFYARFRAGEIYLIKNDLKNAIRYFRAAYDLAAEDKKANVLAKLYIAYAYDHQPDMAGQILNLIHEYDPGSKGNIPAKEYTYMQYIPLQVRDMINEAKNQMRNGKLDDALTLLLKSLEIKDSYVANRFIGEIYFNTGKNTEARYYLEKIIPEFEHDPKFLQTLMLVYLTDKETVKASQCLKQISELEPDYAALSQLKQLMSRY